MSIMTLNLLFLFVTGMVAGWHLRGLLDDMDRVAEQEEAEGE